MQLVQILLPLADNQGDAFPAAYYGEIRQRLTASFGGMTAFTQAPAEGLWQDEAGVVNRDRIVIFEVMAETLDRSWWTSFRQELEQKFRQDRIVVRAQPLELL